MPVYWHLGRSPSPPSFPSFFLSMTMSLPTIAPGKTRIGWIGTGVMGSSMVGHLMSTGFTATIYNRRKEKAEPLLARGAHWANSPKAVAQAADVVFAIVGFPSDVRQVMLGEEGALAG